MGTSIINPKGLNAVGGVYPDEVYANFPVMLRKLALIYVVVAGIGALAIKDPPAPASNGKGDAGKVEAAKGATLGEAIRDQKFWLMWFMVSGEIPSLAQSTLSEWTMLSEWTKRCLTAQATYNSGVSNRVAYITNLVLGCRVV